jgi:phosphoglycerate dehydrogenase-like enzyme
MNRKSGSIGIVNSSTFGRYYPDLMERLEKIGSIERVDVEPEISGEELARRTAGFTYIIASVTPKYTRAFFEHTDGLRLIARHGIGYDNIDVETAVEKGVAVTRVDGVHERDSVAELSVALILVCLRKVVTAANAVQENRWDKRKGHTGKELSTTKVGIIGYGNIGSRTAEIIRDGFHAEVLAYDPYVDDSVMRRDGISPAGFKEILQESDVLSLHASLNKDNYHFIGRREFKLMKRDAVIVNTARGELINESELAEAARCGDIGYAALDVAEREPMRKDNPLIGLENVVIVPHIGGYGEHSLRKMDEKMVEDIEAMASGAMPHQVVNPAVFREKT